MCSQLIKVEGIIHFFLKLLSLGCYFTLNFKSFQSFKLFEIKEQKLTNGCGEEKKKEEITTSTTSSTRLAFLDNDSAELH